MIRVHLAGLGLVAPGLEGWAQAASVLRGEVEYCATPLVPQAPDILSARERRRSSPTVRLALTAALEAVRQSGIPPESLAAVFGSSNGNGLEVHQILEALTKPEHLVSPTQFHNSVHNSAVGYWCISTHCHQASTSIASYDYTFAAALLKGCAQVVAEDVPVLVTAYDLPLPEPLNGKRPVVAPFAMACVLTPKPNDDSIAQLSVSWRGGLVEPCGFAPDSEALQALWLGNPAARALPLLEPLARRQAAAISLQYPAQGCLFVELEPC